MTFGEFYELFHKRTIFKKNDEIKDDSFLITMLFLLHVVQKHEEYEKLLKGEYDD